MKQLIVFLTISLILFISACFLTNSFSVQFDFSEEKDLINQQSEPIKIILVGDIMLDRGVDYMVKKHGNNDFEFPFLETADYFVQADIVFGNLESVISDQGFKVGSIYSFRANPESIKGLKFSGFNVLSLANNHAFDYTRTALENCLQRLKENEINYLGAGFDKKQAFSPIIKEINQTKIGFLAYTNFGSESWQATEQRSGIARISEKDFDEIKQNIKKFKQETDFLIVSLHAGEEYTQELTDFQVNFSRTAVKAGADVIVGHHPHVVQKHEQYEQGWIFYSLGNFIFDQSFSQETMTGQIVEIIIQDKQINQINLLKTEINQYFQPEIIDRLILK
jgi:gamma-polyglutamate biosynthesis protein CapA